MPLESLTLNPNDFFDLKVILINTWVARLPHIYKARTLPDRARFAENSKKEKKIRKMV